MGRRQLQYYLLKYASLATTGLRVRDDVQIIRVQHQQVVDQVGLFNVLDQKFHRELKRASSPLKGISL